MAAVYCDARLWGGTTSRLVKRQPPTIGAQVHASSLPPPCASAGLAGHARAPLGHRIARRYRGIPEPFHGSLPCSHAEGSFEGFSTDRSGPQRDLVAKGVIRNVRPGGTFGLRERPRSKFRHVLSTRQWVSRPWTGSCVLAAGQAPSFCNDRYCRIPTLGFDGEVDWRVIADECVKGSLMVEGIQKEAARPKD